MVMNLNLLSFIKDHIKDKPEKEKIQYPDFKTIIKQCKSKMDEKFPEYGNSWNQTEFPYNVDWDWWFKRLQGEVDEIKKCNNPIQRRNEIIDAVNILAMMIENNNKFVEWEYYELRLGRHG